jgi:hypothetical protein
MKMKNRDDHDYCDNDSTGTCTSREASHEAYRAYVPHYPLSSVNNTLSQPYFKNGSSPGVYQAFTIGRVRVIMTDLRSEAIPGIQMYSDAQRQWFLHELTLASNYSLVIWYFITLYILITLHALMMIIVIGWM